MSCLICEKHKNIPVPVIKENDHAILLHYQTSDEHPTMYKGHLFVEPKRHVEAYSELSAEESAAVSELIHFGTKAQAKVLNPEHTYIFTIMHQVSHLHFHLVPRYSGTPENFWDRGLHDWPEAPRLNQAEVAKLSAELSNCFDDKKS